MNDRMGIVKINRGHHLVRNLGQLMFRPGTFYETLSVEHGFRAALGFLVFSSIMFGIFASVFALQNRVFLGATFSINAIFMPPFMALILYVVNLMGGKNVFTYRTLFGITAYSNITLMLAWIPGMSWAVGLWRFYLIGLGMVKLGKISAFKAFINVLATTVVLMVFIYFLQPLSP
ncbi:MAG: hypothetical protein AMK69_22460 [Nitrospira bacterium SG8_3]|nr:MAG: hypothetical protein AMK69_22460 [Nitrospira bacterium SG8_3]